LGNAWIKSRVEDVRAVVLTADGSELDANVTFVPGSAGLAPFAFGDLDFDGDFDVADFRNVFLGNMLTNTTGLSPAEAYQAGDFNTDGIADELDFLLYNQAYLTANPGATALSLAATTVPEPS